MKHFTLGLFINLFGVLFLTAQTYTSFKAIGPGGGGAMYEPVISPHDGDHLWVVCDMGGMYRSLDGGNSWEVIHMDHLTSTVVSEVQFTSDPNIMYVVSRFTEISSINNQLFRGLLSKSIDGGTTWFVVPEPTVGAGVQVALADPNSAGRVLINDWKNLYFSNDGGSNWTNVYQSALPNDLWLGGAFWDGNDIYVATAEGLLVSHDNGTTFAIEAIGGMPSNHGIFRLEGAKEGGQVRLFALSAASNILFAHHTIDQLRYNTADMYRLDYGTDISWNNIQAGITYSEPVNDLALTYGDIDTIWAAVSHNFGAIFALCLRSTDGGDTWTQMLQYTSNANINTGWGGHGGARDWGWHFLLFGLDVDPNDPDRVIFANDFAHISEDAGATWNAVYVDSSTRNQMGQFSDQLEFFTSSGLDVTGVNDLHFFDADYYMAGNTDIGNMYTQDGGDSWSFRRNILHAWSTDYGPYAHPNWHSFAADQNQNMLYASSAGFGDVYSPLLMSDGLDNWDGFVFRSDDEGQTWDTLNNFNSPVVRISIDPNAPNNLYASVMSYTTNGGIHHSADGGANWNLLAAPPRTEGHPFYLEVLDDGALVATYSGRKVSFLLTPSSGVFYSTDGGATWEDRSDVGMHYYTREIMIDENDPNQNTWYVSVVGRHDYWAPSDPASLGKGGVYKTTDRGLTWTRIFAEEQTQSMTINPLNPAEMYVAVMWGGVYKTTDLNAVTPTFNRVDEFPHPRVRNIVFNPYRPTEMFVLTRGGGLWKRSENTFFFNAKIILEGAFDGDSLMHTYLQNELPLVQPYNQAPYNYTGTESLSAIPSNMVDWVLIEARTGTPNLSGSPGTSVVETKAGILLNDGSIVGTDTIRGIVFNNLSADTSYHFAIRHRNHLDVLTNAAVPTDYQINYDFTTDVNAAFGTNQLKLMPNGQYALYAGDANKDGTIQTTDYDAWLVQTAAIGVYALTDFNLDGVIQVTDYDLWFSNKAKVGSIEF